MKHVLRSRRLPHRDTLPVERRIEREDFPGGIDEPNVEQVPRLRFGISTEIDTIPNAHETRPDLEPDSLIRKRAEGDTRHGVLPGMMRAGEPGSQFRCHEGGIRPIEGRPAVMPLMNDAHRDELEGRRRALRGDIRRVPPSPGLAAKQLPTHLVASRKNAGRSRVIFLDLGFPARAAKGRNQQGDKQTFHPVLPGQQGHPSCRCSF